MEAKVCTGCGEKKSLEDYYPGEGRGGRRSKCKTCFAARVYESNKAWRAANPDRKAASDKAWRKKNPNRARQRAAANKGERSQASKDKKAAANKAWREKNRDRVRQWNKEYHLANREVINERARLWAKANPEARRAQYANSEARRRARIQETQMVPITAAQIETLIEEFNGGCAYCPSPWEHIDHYVPLSRGGEHRIENLVPACAPCNQSKNAKLPIWEWTRRPLARSG